MNLKKLFTMTMSAIIVIMAVFPVNLAAVFANSSPTPVSWPDNWYAYQDASGNPIRDIAGEVSPSDTDITSGVDKGYGNLPSVYVAADQARENLFIRYRMKSNPYDRKGGFLSTAWVVQIIKDINGIPTQVATIGLDGKSPSVDYVYVSNGDGRKVKPIYQTGSNTSNQAEPFPGTRISSDGNGHYFLDFQVPISEIVSISDAQDIVGQNKVMLYFGTSKAANLSVINKEWMSEDKSFNNLKEISMENPSEDLSNPIPIGVDFPTISIDTITGTKNVDGQFTSNSITVSGTVSEDLPITIEINGASINSTVTPANGAWNINLSSYIPDSSGTYQVVAHITKNGVKVKAETNFVISKSTAEGITIDGGSVATTTIANPLLAGTFKTANQGNNIYVMINNVQLSGTASKVSSNTRWQYQLTAGALQEGVNKVRVEIRNNQNTVVASATQQLTYIPGNSTVKAPLTVSIDSISGNSATPTISGSSKSAKTVEVQAIDSNNKVSTIEVITPNQMGSWSTAIEKPLSSGNYTIRAIAINEAGSEVAIATRDHSVNQLSITIDNGTGPITINNNTPIIRGGTNVPDGTTITVTFAGVTYTPTAQNGRWEVVVPLNTPVHDASHAVNATVTFNGSTATATQTIIIKASMTVGITTPVDGSTITNTKRPNISGTAETGASVNLIVSDSSNDVVIVRSLVANGGNWSHTPESDLENDVYTVNVTATDDYGNVAIANSNFSIGSALSPSKEITSFKFADLNPEVVGVIDQTAKTITLTVPYGTDVRNLVPTIVHTGASIDPNNEIVQDFTNPITYTVTAADGTTQLYTVTVTEGASSSKEITSYKFADLNPEVVGIIDQTAKTITLTVPHGTDVTNLAPTIVHTGASIDPNNQVAQDFTSTVPYTVTAADGTSQLYMVTVTVQEKTETPVVTDPIRAGDSTISGTSEPNAIIKIMRDGHEIGTAIANGDGNWTVSFYEGITLAGNDELKVTAKVSGKVESEVATVPVTGIPTPEITGSTDGEGRITVKGAISGAEVILYDKDGNEVGRTIADGDGNATFTNVPGGIDYYVTQTKDGLTSGHSNKINVVEIFGSVDGAKTVTVIGATPDATVTLYNNKGEVVATVEADANGNVLFTNVTPDMDYYVTETVGEITNEPSNKVNVYPRISLRYSIGEIWESVTLPVFVVADNADEVIQWNSNKPEVITISREATVHEGQIFREYKAEVNRQPEDVKVILQAKFTKVVNGESVNITRNFLIIVKGTNNAIDKVTIGIPEPPVKLGGIDKCTVNSNGCSVNNLLIGNNPSVHHIYVSQTTLFSSPGVESHKVDKLEIYETGMNAFINQTSGDEVKIFFDVAGDNEIAVGIPFEALEVFGNSGKQNLTLATREGTLTLTKDQVDKLIQNGDEFYFQIVPNSNGVATSEIQAQAGNNITVLPGSREIVTNYTLYYNENNAVVTEVFLPLPTGVQQSSSLRLFVKHSVGDPTIINPGSNGAKFETRDGVTGLVFEINRFSTFTFFQVNNPAGGSGGFIAPKIVAGFVEDNKKNVVIQFDTIIGNFNKDGLTVVVDGKSVQIESVLSDGKNFIITLKNEVQNGSEVIVNYDPSKGSSHLVLELLKNYKIKLNDFHKAYIKGFPDGTFKPEENVTRAQMAAMLARNLEFDDSKKASSSSYPDVKVTHWAANVIQFVKDQGLMQGDPTGNFRPDAPITRAEMAAIVARFKELTVVETTVGSFTDNSNHWATGIIEANRNSGILEGYEDGSFRPNRNLTRAEASKVVNRMFDRGPLYGITTPSWPDVKPTHWAYHEIEEASQDHYYTKRPEGGENRITK